MAAPKLTPGALTGYKGATSYGQTKPAKPKKPKKDVQPYAAFAASVAPQKKSKSGLPKLRPGALTGGHGWSESKHPRDQDGKWR